MDSEKWWTEQARQEPQPQREEGCRECGPEEIGMRALQAETDFQTDLRMALASCFAAILAAPSKRQARAMWAALRSLIEARYDPDDGEKSDAAAPADSD